MAATMAQAHSVIVDNGRNPPAIRFPQVFNVAVAFIDRHVAEGRGNHAALRTADGDESTVEELQQFCKSNLAGYKYPRWFTFVNELPKTVMGKIQRIRPRQGEGA